MLNETVQRTGNREAGWVNRLFSNEGYTPEHQELKFALHRKLLDRINLEALSSMAGARGGARSGNPRRRRQARRGREDAAELDGKGPGDRRGPGRSLRPGSSG